MSNIPTKEEIYLNHLKNELNGRDLNAQAVIAYLKPEQTKAAYKAMTEYADLHAKNMAIEFDKWKLNNGWTKVKNDSYEPTYRGYNQRLEPVSHTSTELYSIFIEHLNQQQ